MSSFHNNRSWSFCKRLCDSLDDNIESRNFINFFYKTFFFLDLQCLLHSHNFLRKRLTRYFLYLKWRKKIKLLFFTFDAVKKSRNASFNFKEDQIVLKLFNHQSNTIFALLNKRFLTCPKMSLSKNLYSSLI